MQWRVVAVQLASKKNQWLYIHEIVLKLKLNKNCECYMFPFCNMVSGEVFIRLPNQNIIREQVIWKLQGNRVCQM